MRMSIRMKMSNFVPAYTIHFTAVCLFVGAADDAFAFYHLMLTANGAATYFVLFEVHAAMRELVYCWAAIVRTYLVMLLLPLLLLSGSLLLFTTQNSCCALPQIHIKSLFRMLSRGNTTVRLFFFPLHMVIRSFSRFGCMYSVSLCALRFSDHSFGSNNVFCYVDVNVCDSRCEFQPTTKSIIIIVERRHTSKQTYKYTHTRMPVSTGCEPSVVARMPMCASVCTRET